MQKGKRHKKKNGGNGLFQKSKDHETGIYNAGLKYFFFIVEKPLNKQF